MKLFHVVISGCITLFLYFVLQALWGNSGISALSNLKDYQASLEQNVQSLRDSQNSLASDISRIRNDPSRLREEANRIGMLDDGDIELRLDDKALPQQSISPGTMIRKPDAGVIPMALICGISLSIGLVTLLLLNVINLESSLIAQGRTRKKNHGVRVQTASLE